MSPEKKDDPKLGGTVGIAKTAGISSRPFVIGETISILFSYKDDQQLFWTLHRQFVANKIRQLND